MHMCIYIERERNIYLCVCALQVFDRCLRRHATLIYRFLLLKRNYETYTPRKLGQKDYGSVVSSH